MSNPNGCANRNCPTPQKGVVVDVTIRVIAPARCEGCVGNLVNALTAMDAIRELRVVADGSEWVAARPEVKG